MANGETPPPTRERDVRGLLAVMCVIGAFGLAVLSIVLAIVRNISLGEGVSPATFLEIPSWTSGIVGTVIGYYFGSKGATGSVEQVAQGVAQGVKIDSIHELVNSRFKELADANILQRDQLEESRIREEEHKRENP